MNLVRQILIGSAPRHVALGKRDLADPWIVQVAPPTDGMGFVLRTTDSGATWKGPTAVSEDPTKRHFKFAMASSPSGRVIGLVWRTRQSGTATVGPYNVWAAISDDEGATFTEPLKISGADSPGEDPAYPGLDDLSDIALNDEYAFFAWGDWRPGDRSGYFGAARLAAFRHK